MSRRYRALGRELRAEPEPRRRLPIVAMAGWVLRHLPELAILLLLVHAWRWAAARTGPLWTELLGVMLLCGGMSWGRSRRWLLAPVGCEFSRARLRAALAELRLTRRDGRPPIMFGVVPTATGERVWLLCPIRVAAEDIAEEADRLAAACFARGLRVARHRRWPAVVVLDVIRRDRQAGKPAMTWRLVLGAPARVTGHPA